MWTVERVTESASLVVSNSEPHLDRQVILPSQCVTPTALSIITQSSSIIVVEFGAGAARGSWGFG
jgi:hypothetical protein